MGIRAQTRPPRLRIDPGVAALAATLAFALVSASNAPGSQPGKAAAVAPYGDHDAGGSATYCRPVRRAPTRHPARAVRGDGRLSAPLDRSAAPLRQPDPGGRGAHQRDDPRLLQGRHLRREARRRRVDDDAKARRDDPPRPAVRDPAHLRHLPLRRDVRDRLRGSPGPPLPDGHPAHTGRAQLSSFVGGSPSNRAMDRAEWQLAPYTEADLQKQIDDAGKIYGKAGVKLVQDVKDYVAGINAYIAAAKKNPSLMPAEYAALGKLPQPWKATDVVAEASLIGGIFGKGGGRSSTPLSSCRRSRSASAPRRAGAPGSTPAPRTTPRRRRRSRSASPMRRRAPSPSAAWRCPTGAPCTRRPSPRRCRPPPTPRTPRASSRTWAPSSCRR